jgi:hypothetical protein
MSKQKQTQYDVRCTQHVLNLQVSCTELVLWSYFGLNDARMSASDKELPVQSSEALAIMLSLNGFHFISNTGRL